MLLAKESNNLEKKHVRRWLAQSISDIMRPNYKYDTFKSHTNFFDKHPNENIK